MLCVSLVIGVGSAQALTLGKKYDQTNWEEVKEILMHISGRYDGMRVLRVDNDQDCTLEGNAQKIAKVIQCAYLEALDSE